MKKIFLEVIIKNKKIKKKIKNKNKNNKNKSSEFMNNFSFYYPYG